jgi:hypothetical protein
MCLKKRLALIENVPLVGELLLKKIESMPNYQTMQGNR